MTYEDLLWTLAVDTVLIFQINTIFPTTIILNILYLLLIILDVCNILLPTKEMIK